MKASDFLKQAQAEMQDRAKTYDNPAGERSMQATVAAFNAITGQSMATVQGWLFMALLKAVRSQQGAYKADNFVDFAAYASLMGECAAAESIDSLQFCAPSEISQALKTPDPAHAYVTPLTRKIIDDAATVKKKVADAWSMVAADAAANGMAEYVDNEKYQVTFEEDEAWASLKEKMAVPSEEMAVALLPSGNVLGESWNAVDFEVRFCKHERWHFYQSTHQKTCTACGYTTAWNGAND